MDNSIESEENNSKNKAQALFYSSPCSTCIFSKDSPLREGALKELKKEWSKGKIQICHHSSMEGGNIGCYGALRSYRRGEIPGHPIDLASSQAGFPEDMEPEVKYRVFLHLGFIKLLPQTHKKVKSE